MSRLAREALLHVKRLAVNHCRGWPACDSVHLNHNPPSRPPAPQTATSSQPLLQDPTPSQRSILYRNYGCKIGACVRQHRKQLSSTYTLTPPPRPGHRPAPVPSPPTPCMASSSSAKLQVQNWRFWTSLYHSLCLTHNTVQPFQPPTISISTSRYPKPPPASTQMKKVHPE